MYFKHCGPQTDAMINHWRNMIALLAEGGMSTGSLSPGIYQIFQTTKLVIFKPNNKYGTRQGKDFHAQNKEVLEYLGYTIKVQS